MPPALQDSFGELGGRTVGLVGYGAVARALARLLHAFECTVLVAARTPPPDQIRRSVPELLAESDIVSLHVPLTPETRHLIGRDALERMKPGAILINTARGGLVDQGALIAALETGRLAGAGLDVFDPEPIASRDPLLARPDVVVTPHAAWLTPETWRRSLDVAAENVRRLAAGEALLHRVA
ncbi:MAG TPA: NAD(P)-dependent oxidoreductase [Acetobacteraceae bacterium]|nr:NAD(P)-dependent oxidoreductase [Acetobacteraceae bacterium]